MIDSIYRCEICGDESQNPQKWIVIQCNSAQLTVFKWTKEAADAPGARHYCGEAHAQIVQLSGGRTERRVAFNAH
jgi:hypothetical protein